MATQMRYSATSDKMAEVPGSATNLTSGTEKKKKRGYSGQAINIYSKLDIFFEKDDRGINEIVS